MLRGKEVVLHSEMTFKLITFFCNILNQKWIKAGFRIFRQGGPFQMGIFPRDGVGG